MIRIDLNGCIFFITEVKSDQVPAIFESGPKYKGKRQLSSANHRAPSTLTSLTGAFGPDTDYSKATRVFFNFFLYSFVV